MRMSGCNTRLANHAIMVGKIYPGSICLSSSPMRFGLLEGATSSRGPRVFLTGLPQKLRCNSDAEREA